MKVDSIAPTILESDRYLAWALADVDITATVAILPLGAKKARCMAWTSHPAYHKSGWQRGEAAAHMEIALTAESLDRPMVDVLQTLQHESVHVRSIALRLANPGKDKDFRDTAKSGRHNKRFRESAETHGLEVILGADGKPTDSYGYGYTRFQPTFEAAMFEQFEPDEACFGLHRIVQQVKTPGPPLWGCPECSQPTSLGPHKGRAYERGDVGTNQTGAPSVRLMCPDCMRLIVPGRMDGDQFVAY